MAELDDSGISVLNHSTNDSVLENENKVNAEVTSDIKMEDKVKVDNANQRQNSYMDFATIIKYLQKADKKSDELNNKFEKLSEKSDEFRLEVNDKIDSSKKDFDNFRLEVNNKIDNSKKDFDKLNQKFEDKFSEFRQEIKEAVAKFDEPLEVPDINIVNTVENVSKEIEFDDRPSNNNVLVEVREEINNNKVVENIFEFEGDQSVTDYANDLGNVGFNDKELKVVFEGNKEIGFENIKVNRAGARTMRNMRTHGTPPGRGRRSAAAKSSRPRRL